MFTRIQTKHFRSLKSVDQQLGPVQALIGPNASGKTTFLDVLNLLSDLLRDRGNVKETINARSANFEKLIWQGPSKDSEKKKSFEIAVEAAIPQTIRNKMSEDKKHFDIARYELEIGLDATTETIGINHETLWLRRQAGVPEPVQKDFFPLAPELAETVLTGKTKAGQKAILKKNPAGNDNYYTQGKATYSPSFRLGRTKLALANIPADEDSFPVSLWFKDLLEQGVQNFVLNSQKIRQPSPPGQGWRFLTDGSNLPWVISHLRQDKGRFQAWLNHVRTALNDIDSIDVVEREDDKHKYLVVKYKNGAVVPSWLVSDGTLRLLALTLPAYLSNMSGVFLIEEPENGIHPRAMETVIQSLSSIYDGQVLIATHSPIVLSMLSPGQILCFAKDATGATDIVAGNNHPALRRWHESTPDLGVIFAAGILS
jgi:predicted ATPase